MTTHVILIRISVELLLILGMYWMVTFVPQSPQAPWYLQIQSTYMHLEVGARFGSAYSLHLTRKTQNSFCLIILQQNRVWHKQYAQTNHSYKSTNLVLGFIYPGSGNNNKNCLNVLLKSLLLVNVVSFFWLFAAPTCTYSLYTSPTSIQYNLCRILYMYKGY